MILYNNIIENVGKITDSLEKKSYVYNKPNAWPEQKTYELILQKEMGYELGGDQKPAVSFTLVTTNEKYFNGDEIVVCGPDLGEIKTSSPYARITMLLTYDIESDDETDTETAFRAIQDMDFIKYHVFPRGFMVRTSGQKGREQVRVGKAALKRGVNFERIGETFIRHYKQNKNVRAVKEIFITAPDANYKELESLSKKTTDITQSLSQILEGLPTECGSCGLKDICDEVEGMRELHFGKKDKK